MTHTLEELKAYLKDKQEELSLAPTPQDRLEMLVEYGKELPDFPKEKITDKNRVPGCVSGVFIDAHKDGERIFFDGKSDSFIVKGYVAILIYSLSGLTPKEIAQAKGPIERFVEETGISKSLIASRANAFGNIFKMMLDKAQALA